MKTATAPWAASLCCCLSSGLADGWFRVPAGVTADAAIPMPIPGTSQQPFADPSDDFTSPELGLQWGFWHEFDPARFTTGNGALTLAGAGQFRWPTPPP